MTALFDYTLLPYEPVSDVDGKHTSSFVLDAVIDAAGAGDLRRSVRSLQTALGVDATVWGAKRDGSGYSWELYFYDYSREDPRYRVDNVLEAVGDAAPALTLAVAEHPRRHFMFSVDVCCSAPRPVHLYFYDVGERMTGLSYGAAPDGWVLENHYAFYEPGGDDRVLREKVQDSPHLPPGASAQAVLVPELLACRRICVANKPTCDGVYFSGVRLSQFLRFLEAFGHDPALVSTIARNENALDHMLYDVAFDYRVSPSGEVEVLKSAFYGTA
jgi:hypothetical protein